MDDTQSFIEDMGQHMTGWGLARTTGRIYAYLLLQAEPVGLERMAADLGIAKSGASVGARQLLAFGMARAIGERGSRRVRYEALTSLEAIVAARDGQVRDLVERLRQGAAAAPSGPGRQRLADMAEMTAAVRKEIAAAMQRVRARR